MSEPSPALHQRAVDALRMHLLNSNQGDSTLLSMRSVLHTQAPGRLNIIGEHVDYVGGRVLPAAVPMRCEVVGFRIGKQQGLRNIGSSVLAVAGTGDATITSTTESVVVDVDSANSVNAQVQQLERRKTWRTFVVAALHEVIVLLPELNGPSVDEALNTLQSMALYVEGNVPTGAGLSSSAALCVALVISFAAIVTGRETFSHDEKIAMIKAARRIENVFCGVGCGIMDQFASMFGEPDAFLEVNCDTLAHRVHPLNAVLGNTFTFVLVNSMNAHSLGDEYNVIRRNIEDGQRFVGLHWKENEQFTFCDAVAASCGEGRERGEVPLALRRALDAGVISEDQHRCCAYVVEEMLRTQQLIDLVSVPPLSDEDRDAAVRTMGQLLNATHRGLSTQLRVSTEELDFIQSYCCDGAAPLAVGGRLMGGGFGGCCILLVQSNQIESLLVALPKSFFDRFGVRCDVYPVSSLAGGASVSFLPEP